MCLFKVLILTPKLLNTTNQTPTTKIVVEEGEANMEKQIFHQKTFAKKTIYLF